jgi:hypothetical protein
MVYVANMKLYPADSMVDYRHCGRKVIGQFRTANESRLGAVMVCDFADLFVVGADNDVVEQVAILRSQNRIGNKGLATEFAHILTWDTLTSTATRNNCDSHFTPRIKRFKENGKE